VCIYIYNTFEESDMILDPSHSTSPLRQLVTMALPNVPSWSMSGVERSRVDEEKWIRWNDAKRERIRINKK